MADSIESWDEPQLWADEDLEEVELVHVRSTPDPQDLEEIEPDRIDEPCLFDPGPKICLGCKLELVPEAFPRCSTAQDGRSMVCTDCTDELEEQRRAAKREKARLYHINNRGKRREAGIRWRGDNPGRNAALCRRWRGDNPDEKREYDRSWDLANPEKRRAIKARYEARKRAAKVPGAPVTPEIEAGRIEFWGFQCWICGTDLFVPGANRALDHTKPFLAGGLDLGSNIRPTCGTCNSKKGYRWPFPTRPDEAYRELYIEDLLGGAE